MHEVLLLISSVLLWIVVWGLVIKQWMKEYRNVDDKTEGHIREREKVVRELRAVYCEMASKRMERELDSMYQRVCTLDANGKLPTYRIPNG